MDPLYLMETKFIAVLAINHHVIAKQYFFNAIKINNLIFCKIFFENNQNRELLVGEIIAFFDIAGSRSYLQ